MTTLKEVHSGGGFGNKLGNSVLADPVKVPYVQMTGRSQRMKSCWYKPIILLVPVLIFLGLTSFLLLVVTQEEYWITNEGMNDNDESPKPGELQWNELIFTQMWGYSSCVEFKDKHFPKDVTCRYEERPAFWSIHGIWPTEGGSEGPNFCTKVKFNITLLDPIRSSLDEYWYEIDNTKDGKDFWQHEWVKHGSCAKELDTFATELKYFSTALELRKKFDLYSILKNGNVTPQGRDNNTGYSLSQITNAITNSLGESAVPYVQCLAKKDMDTNLMEYYLLAVELCFDKDLQSIPCKTHKQLSANLRDSALPCPKTASIKYVDAVDATL